MATELKRIQDRCARGKKALDQATKRRDHGLRQMLLSARGYERWARRVRLFGARVDRLVEAVGELQNASTRRKRRSAVSNGSENSLPTP